MRDVLIAAALLASPSSRPPAAQVTVSVSAALQDKAAIYGDREFPELQRDLEAVVASRAAKGGFTRVELVLENAIPNRPTTAMLSRTVRFDLSSLSRGGARISGTAYGPAGSRPIRFSWWSHDLRDSAGSAIWTDAERAFQLLGSELGHGHVPDRFNDGDAPLDWAASGSSIDNPGGRR